MKKEQLLADIAELIRLKIEKELNDGEIESYGLYGGAFGQLLFLSRYRKYATDKSGYDNLHDTYLEKCLDGIADGTFTFPTFCSGLPGALHFLRKEYKGDLDLSEAEPVLDIYLKKCLNHFLKQDNWDFLHGALGIGYSYLSREDGNEIHETILNYLEENSVEEEGRRKILSERLNEEKYNISLSHGMSSIVAYLSALHCKMPQERVARLLTEFVVYISDQQIDFATYGSCFPSFSAAEEPLKGSRLGWCYGDLGIACAIYQAGEALRKPEWMSLALSVLDRSVNRRDLAKNFIMDSCICHGTAGVALIFHEMYKKTRKPEYKETADFWMEQTSLMAKYEDGLAGFKTYRRPDNKPKYVNEYGMLEGIVGVGMMMMALMYDEEWGDILMVR